MIQVSCLWAHNSVSLLFHCFPGLYFIVSHRRCYTCVIAFIFHCQSQAMLYLCYCYPGLYFIAYLGLCYTHVITTQAYISLLTRQFYFIFWQYLIACHRPVSLGEYRGKILPKKETIEHICRTLNIQKSCD